MENGTWALLWIIVNVVGSGDCTGIMLNLLFTKNIQQSKKWKGIRLELEP